MKERVWTENEEVVIDWALTNRSVAPATESCRATCEQLAGEGILEEQRGPDPRFTIFVPSERVWLAARDLAKQRNYKDWL